MMAGDTNAVERAIGQLPRRPNNLPRPNPPPEQAKPTRAESSFPIFLEMLRTCPDTRNTLQQNRGSSNLSLARARTVR